MSANEARATINMTRALQVEIRAWAVDATGKLGAPVSFQDACRAILAAGVSDPEAGKAAIAELRREGF